MAAHEVLRDSPLSFVPSRSLVLDRLDCEWSHPKYADLSRHLEELGNRPGWDIRPLGKPVEVIYGKRLPKGSFYLPPDLEGIPFVRVEDVKHFAVDLSGCARISEQLYETAQNPGLSEGDVAITIVGTIGRAGVVRERVDQCALSDNLAKLVIEESAQILPEYLCYFLMSELGQRQIRRYTVGSLQRKLSLASLRRSILVVFPLDLEQQRVIVREVESLERVATKNRRTFFSAVESRHEAVRELLNIPMPRLGATITFSVTSDSLVDRLDAVSHSPFLKELRESMTQRPHKRLGDLAERAPSEPIPISAYYRLIELEQVDELLGEVHGVQEVDYVVSGKIVLRDGQLGIGRISPEKGKIFIVDDQLDGCLASTEIVPLQLRKSASEDDSDLLTYLWAILRSEYVLEQWRHQVTGSTRMRIGRSELGDTLVPFPARGVRGAIIEATLEADSKARAARDDYEAAFKQMTDTFCSLIERPPREPE